MKTVGIIANPAAGKDIRRLVAEASTFDNNEKVNIIRRILLGLDAVGVEQVWLMQDYYGICGRAVENLDRELKLKLTYLDFPLYFNGSDSSRAAGMMAEQDVACILTLGGDGTNRVVAKGCGQIPLLPISTGTNNVFPYMLEGTLAGMAAGLLAMGVVSPEEVCEPTPRLEIECGQQMVDIALVDAIVYDDRFTGTKAIWEIDEVRQVVLARAEPYQIGFSSVGGNLNPAALKRGTGMEIEVGPGSLQVLSPIAPGSFKWIPVRRIRLLNAGEAVTVAQTPSVIALDGEREVMTACTQNWLIRLTQNGPSVVDPRRALHLSAERGFFVRHCTEELPEVV